MAKNIIVTGFMGTGKSTVGKLVAAELGRNFLDMDTLIEQREGRSINQVFAEQGEPYFRQLEVDFCVELAAQKSLVIATGGGTLVLEANLRTMENTGLVVCLDCEAEELWRRIGQAENRPMLAGRNAGRFARLSALLEKRAPAYARIKRHVNVTDLSPADVARQICIWAQSR